MRSFRDDWPDAVSLPQAFKEQGFLTCGFGKVIGTVHHTHGADPPITHHSFNHALTSSINEPPRSSTTTSSSPPPTTTSPTLGAPSAPITPRRKTSAPPTRTGGAPPTCPRRTSPTRGAWTRRSHGSGGMWQGRMIAGPFSGRWGFGSRTWTGPSRGRFWIGRWHRRVRPSGFFVVFGSVCIDTMF